MPRMCSVLGCRSNYKSQAKDGHVTTFSLPKDVHLRNQWLRMLPPSIDLLKKPSVCIKHFPESSIIRVDVCTVRGERVTYPRKIPKLKKGSVPSIFANVPEFVAVEPTASQQLKNNEDDEKIEMPTKHIDKKIEVKLEAVEDGEIICNEFDFMGHNINIKDEIKIEYLDCESDTVTDSVTTSGTHHEVPISSGMSCGEVNEMDGNKSQEYMKEQSKSEEFISDVDYSEWIECNLCGRKCMLECHLAAHMKRYHREKDVNEGVKDRSESVKPKEKKESICDVCGKVFKTESGFEKHVNLHVNITPFKCPVCNEGFELKDGLVSHMIVHAEYRPFKCHVCSDDFKIKDDLTKHLEIHTNERRFKCDMCNKEMKKKGDLARHIQMHTDDRPVKCGVCNKGFRNKNYLARHMVVHSGDRPYKCDVCSKTFRQKSYLKEHAYLHGERPFKCDVCGKGFTTRKRLKEHVGVHTGQSLYKCKVCNKGFRRRDNLKTHVLLHADKSFMCEVCSVRFRYNKSLLSHMRIHTTDRPKRVRKLKINNLIGHRNPYDMPYKCDKCRKRFKTNDSFEAHIVLHSENPFVCEVCSKIFQHEKDLTKHMVIHTDDRPFECDVCYKKLKYRNDLARHMRIHRDHWPFICDICPAKFKRSDGLRAHLKVHADKIV